MSAVPRRVRLEDICTRITVGHVGPMASEYVDDGVPFLRSQNIAPFRLRLDDVKFISPDFHNRLKKSALRPGDVAVIRTGYPGVAAVIPSTLPDANCADLVVITPSASELDPYYLAAIFNSTWGQSTVSGNLVGVAQQHFNIGAARNLQVLVPTLPEQRRIAGILSTYDDLIDNCRRRIRVFDEMARALYREWFVLYRYPGHERTPMVDSPIGRIPKGWRTGQLASIAQEIRRGVAKGALAAGVERYVGLEHIPRRSLALDAWEELHELGSNKLRFRKGEILFGKIRPYFHKVSVAPFDGICSADTFVFSATTPALNALATCVLSSDALVARASATANGAKMPRANWDVMARFPIALPPEAILKTFSSRIEPLLADQIALVTVLQNLHRTRDLLLPRLLSRQLAVAEADEAA